MKLTLQGISKTFAASENKIEALRNIDLTVCSGEFVVLLGPSGSGKSTLLEISAGLMEPTQGQVLVNGKHIIEPNPNQAFVFQSYALFPWLTVLGNLHFVLRAQKIPSIEWPDRCTHYLELVNLLDFSNSYPDQLSGGMKQRVALARALIGKPSILLMDEPFGSLDAITRRQLQIMLLKVLSDFRVTVLFVTHSIKEALTLADRIVIFTARPGQIREVIQLPSRSKIIDFEAGYMSSMEQHIWNLLDTV